MNMLFCLLVSVFLYVCVLLNCNAFKFSRPPYFTYSRTNILGLRQPYSGFLLCVFSNCQWQHLSFCFLECITVYEIQLVTFFNEYDLYHFFPARLSPTSWTSARMHELAWTMALKSSPGPPWVAATPTHIAAPLSVFLWGPPCPHTPPSLSHSPGHEMGANQYTSRRRTLI